MKALLWLLVAVGLLPCVFLALAGLPYWRLVGRRQSLGSGDVLVHDEYFRVEAGFFSLEIYPRLWAFVVLGLGVLAIVVALVALLHVPKSPGVD
jgi:hypothetical protein